MLRTAGVVALLVAAAIFALSGVIVSDRRAIARTSAVVVAADRASLSPAKPGRVVMDKKHAAPGVTPVGGDAGSGRCERRKSREHGATYVVVRGAGGPTPERVLVMFHGCSHTAHDFCRHDDTTCPACIGLPSELDFVAKALERGWTVVAVSSADRRTGCWHGDKDAARVSAVLQEEGLDKLPFATMGASSGGTFAMKFAIDHATASSGADPPLCIGVIAQVAAPRFAKALREGPSPPRVVWSIMRRDTRLLHAAKDAYRAARKGLGPEADAHTCLVEHSPRPLSAVLPQALPAAAVDDVVAALAESGLADEGGLLSSDPRRSAWRKHVEPALQRHGIHDTLTADKSPVAELFNVAYGQHEFTSEHAAAMLAFIEGAGTCPGRGKSE